MERIDNRVQLIVHRIWKPSPTAPLDIEATIEAFLREVCDQYRVSRILCAPYQLHRSITTLKAAGFPIQEFPQTTGNTTKMGTGLYDLIKTRNLLMYGDEELREQALNCVAVETPLGFRVAKEKASKKIDAIVSLSMACVAALQPRRAGNQAIGLLVAEDINLPTQVISASAIPRRHRLRIGLQATLRPPFIGSYSLHYSFVSLALIIRNAAPLMFDGHHPSLTGRLRVGSALSLLPRLGVTKENRICRATSKDGQNPSYCKQPHVEEASSFDKPVQNTHRSVFLI